MEAEETADLLVAAEETTCLLVVRVEDSEKDIAFKSGMNRLFCTRDFLSRLTARIWPRYPVGRAAQ